VIKAVRTQHLSALASRQCLRRQRHDPLLGVGSEEERLGVGEVRADSGRSASPASIASAILL
jgi:hypothetical protein